MSMGLLGSLGTGMLRVFAAGGAGAEQEPLLFLSPTVAFRCRSMLFWTSGGGEQKVTCWFSPRTNVFKRWHQQWGRGGTRLSCAFSALETQTSIPGLMHFPSCTNRVWKVWSTQQGKSKRPWASLCLDSVFSLPLIRREQMCLLSCVCLCTPPDVRAVPVLVQGSSI